MVTGEPQGQSKSNQILEHLCRYRITTPAVVQSLFFPSQQETAARAILRGLDDKKGRASGLITSRPLYANHVYFQLNKRGARECGQPEEVANPLGPQALPRAFGVLMTCCGRGAERKRITRREFQSYFPRLVADGLPFNDYFLERVEGGAVLNRIVVDLGGDAERLVRKLELVLREIDMMPSGLELLESDAFQFLVVSSSKRKSQAITSAKERVSPALPLATEAVEELIQVLPNFYESKGQP